MPRVPLMLSVTGFAFFALGCSCGLGDLMSDKLEEKIHEEIAEEIAEAVTGAEDIELNEGGASMTIKTPEGELVVQGEGSAAVPAGFPLPVYPSARVAGSMNSNASGQQGHYLMLQTPDAPAKVADFYEQALKADGQTEVTRTDINQDGQQAFMLAAKKGEAGTAIMIGRDKETTSVVITVGMQ